MECVFCLCCYKFDNYITNVLGDLLTVLMMLKKPWPGWATILSFDYLDHTIIDNVQSYYSVCVIYYYSVWITIIQCKSQAVGMPPCTVLSHDFENGDENKLGQCPVLDSSSETLKWCTYYQLGLQLMIIQLQYLKFHVLFNQYSKYPNIFRLPSPKADKNCKSWVQLRSRVSGTPSCGWYSFCL